jgi:DMSO reductase anchor subunit
MAVTGAAAPRAVELIPAEGQTLWGVPAVANFVCGGLGAGLYVAAALAAGGGPSPAVTVASWLAPLLVAVGFAAVASEAGRPFRGLRVLVRLRTSWMSRELWIGGAFVLLAGAEFGPPVPGRRLAAALAGVVLALAQGFILRGARGVAAWTVPVMPLTFLASALVSGGGLFVLIEAWGGRPLDGALLRALVVLLALSLLVWVVSLWSADRPGSARPGRSLRERVVAMRAVGGGHIVPAAFLALALAAPVLALPAAVAGAALMIGGQAWMKAALILKAGRLRPITIPNVRQERRPA